MKIIDLLVKRANGEEMPKKIKYRDRIWEYTSTVKGKGYQYYSKGYEEWKTLQNQVYLEECLNEEAEIIEEDKKIKMLEPVRGSDLTDLTSKDVVLKNNALIELCKTLNNINNKVNELICEANKLKGEK